MQRALTSAGQEARGLGEQSTRPAASALSSAAVAEHPELFTGPHLTPGQIAQRDRENAMNCEAESLRAFLNGDYAAALRFIDDAEWWLPA